MREFKFRAWSLDHNCWFDCESSQLPRYLKGYANPVMENIDHKSVIVQQYTGLKDKHDREIYEGDICRVNDPHINEPVLECIYVEDGPWYVFGFVGDRHKHNPTYKMSPDCEIIGNIFEKPVVIK